MLLKFCSNQKQPDMTSADATHKELYFLTFVSTDILGLRLRKSTHLHTTNPSFRVKRRNLSLPHPNPTISWICAGTKEQHTTMLTFSSSKLSIPYLNPPMVKSLHLSLPSPQPNNVLNLHPTQKSSTHLHTVINHSSDRTVHRHVFTWHLIIHNSMRSFVLFWK